MIVINSDQHQHSIVYKCHAGNNKGLKKEHYSEMDAFKPIYESIQFLILVTVLFHVTKQIQCFKVYGKRGWAQVIYRLLIMKFVKIRTI